LSLDRFLAKSGGPAMAPPEINGTGAEQQRLPIAA
jgi:hypothetical protein